MPKQPAEMLLNNGWPAGGDVSTSLTQQLKFLTSMKSELRLSLDKAAAGGKKKGKGKGGAQAAPEAPKENCIIAIGTQYPEF